jgi:predicted dehydrogenase/threonine dehydrogenase-like Zn-dependent dehydrogenase
MRAILEDLKSGEIATYDVPAPELRAGGILVRTAFSAISAGTEKAKLETSEKSLLGKAMARPDLVKQVIDFARKNGLKAAYTKVQSKLETLSPMGYSCSGEVIAVGEGAEAFQVGDRVACAGGGYASHCEINWIPCNLAVKIPESVALESACLTTIGAIAAQGLRQSQAVFGETVIVIGAGLVGVLTIQLARAAGCRVIALDLDSIRVERATSFGANLALLSSAANLESVVRDFSRYGGDVAIITAATRSAEPLVLAARLLRDRGRIVVVGDVGMGVSRSSLYHKELELLVSRSYGPGRYDPEYEEGGHDYPVGYVRWTEKRNMEAFLDLLASGAIDVSPLLEKRYAVDEAEKAYAELRAGKSYTAIVEYAPREHKADRVMPALAKRASVGKLRVGCIGAGSFARAHVFPNLNSKAVSLESVGTASGVSAESARKNFGFARAQTPSEIVSDPEIDAIFITTRHSSHAHYVVQGIDSNKAVFVEKPLAVNREQLEQIREACRSSEQRGKEPFLMVGFNRRFAPATRQIREFFADRREPMMIHVRINAGFIARDRWTQQAGEGGRIIGEFCHFLDWARCIAGVPIRSVSAAALPDGSRYHHDNVSAVLTFDDGSIASLLYLANGNQAVSKEFYEVFCRGAVARLADFRKLELARDRKLKAFKQRQDKGHRAEFECTLQAMTRGGESPIPLAEILEVTEATFSVREALAGKGLSVRAGTEVKPFDSGSSPVHETEDRAESAKVI